MNTYRHNSEYSASEAVGSDLSRRMFLKKTGSSTLMAAAGTLVFQAGAAYPQPTGKQIRMGVVGGGFGATFHWHEHPDCIVTGVTDLRADRRERLKQAYQCDVAYDSLEEMVKQAKDIDAVAIFSGAPDHVNHAVMCMERGWHVVSACPACISLEEAQKLKETKEHMGLKYMMAESSYYRQECIFARNFYKTGGFGELFYSEVEYYHDHIREKLVENKKSRWYMPDGSPSWRWGFPPMLYPTHSLGYLVGVTKERIVKVSSLGWKAKHDRHPELNTNAYGNNPYRCESSMMLTDKGHMARCNIFKECVASGEQARWFGENATFYMGLSGVNVPVVIQRPELRETYPIPRQQGGGVEIPEYWKTDMLPEAMRHRSGHGGSAVFLSAEFVNALLEDREPVIDVYESLAMTIPGMAQIRDISTKILPQVDGVLMSPGILRDIGGQLCGHRDSPMPITRINWSTIYCFGWDYHSGDTVEAFSPKDVLQLGAQMVLISLSLQSGSQQRDAENVRLFCKLCNQAHRLGLGVIGEYFPVDEEKLSEHQLHEEVKVGCRVLYELGADVIKTFYTHKFEEVVSGCPTPILALGGKKLSSDLETLMYAKQQIDSGAAGIVYGRNVIQSSKPLELQKALIDVVKHQQLPEEAVRNYGID